MAITIKHAKHDNIADWTQADLDAQIAAGNYPPGTLLADIVLPSDWNNDHTVTGLGTMATQDANAVSITGGTMSGVAITGYIPTTQKGVANGVATLDSGGQVPLSQLPPLGDLNYQGTWNASTNSPTLTSSVGTKGYYYVVNVAGSTNLNGITDWQVNDWAVFNGSVWQKIDNTDAVNSVNGKTGTVVLTYGDITSGVVPVVNGGTGVTTSSGANSVVLRDANGNITTNCLFEGFTSQANGSLITLTASSVQNWVITGSGGQTIKLPDATTLPSGALFTFNNNQSSGTIIVQNNSGTTIDTLQSGSFSTVVLLNNSTAAGSWDKHDQAPANVSWSTNTFDYPGSITSATWNGNAIALNRGGTNANLTAVNGGAVYSTGTALAISAAGTSGQVLTSSGAGAPTWTTPTTGTVTSVTGTAPVVSSGGTTPAISMAAANGTTNGYLTSTDWTTFNNKGSGTVTSVSWTGGIVSVGTSTTTPAFTIAGTSGGIPYFSSGTTWASSAALASNALVIGGGAGVAPSTLASTGTTTTVLHGNASGAPTFGAVSLTADVSGTLPATNGGTGTATTAVGDLLQGGATNTWTKLSAVATGNALISGGITTASSWGKIGLTTHITGILPVANGGTNASAAGITAFNNITGYTASGATGTTSTNLVFSTAPTFTTTIDGSATFGAFGSSTALTMGYTGTGATSTTNISTAALTGAFTKTINIGTNGTTGSTTAINIGTSVGSTTTITGTVSLGTALPIASGGTNSTATPTAGGAGYGTGTAHAYTAAGTSGQPLISAGSSAPAFGTLALGTANTNVSGTLTVTNGGTGAATLTGVIKGTGTTAMVAATAGTDYVAPGTATNFTAQQYFGTSTLTDGATISWAANTQQVATVTIAGNRTMAAPTGLVSGAFYALNVIQDATGSRTMTWNAVFKWTGGTAPTLSTAANAKDFFVFRSDGTNLYEQGRSLGVA
jgi:hypothetical protein